MDQKLTITAFCLFASAAYADSRHQPRAPSAPTPLTGVVSGFQERQRGKLDGALLIPSLRAEKLLSLQLSEFLSPNEEISAGPRKIEVPGNLYLPSQSEKYGIININISKESFTLYPEPGVKSEIAALSFQADFSELVKLGKNKAPITAMLPYVKFGSVGFASDRDWSVYTQPVGFRLSQAPSYTLNYTWTRTGTPQGSQDTIVNFQKTPAGRWLPTDFKGAPAAAGAIGTYANFPNETKTAFLRLYNSNNPAETGPIAGVGWIRNQGASGTIHVQNLPEPLSGLRLNGQSVSWTPIRQHGWVAIARSSDAANRIRKDNPWRGISIGLADFAPSTPREAPQAQLLGWAPASEGRATLNQAISSTDHVSLIFIGTDRPVPAPRVGLNMDPELFTYATELRFARVQ